jgi:hypothetical protein
VQQRAITMAKKKQRGNAIVYRGYLHLHKPLLESEDFINLKGNSLKMLIDLGAQYNGRNNGDLCAARSVLTSRGWNSNQQIKKALDDLKKKNLIMQTKQGGRNIGPNLYAITWQPIDECNGKLDVEPSLHPPRNFR